MSDQVTRTEKSMQHNGFEISISKADPDSYQNEGGSPDDVVIFVDTPEDFKGELRIRINDALLYKGNPENPEEVAHDDLDGYYIIDKQ